MTAAAKPTPDISHVTFKAKLLLSLDMALAGVLKLSPPATPKGRYALAKAAKALGPAVQTYNEQKLALLTEHAKRDDKGQPITQTVDQTVSFDFGLGFGAVTPDVTTALEELNDEDVSLPGVRMISHAELGECPITGEQEAVLLGVLLIDEEPA